jgi:hypothetical protein
VVSVYATAIAVRLGTVRWCRSLLDELAAVERELWLLVGAALVVDVWLTQTGLQIGLQEGNPVMRVAIDAFGVAVLAAAKLLVLGLAGVTRLAMDGRRGVVVPLRLALPWLAAVLVNGALIALF